MKLTGFAIKDNNSIYVFLKQQSLGTAPPSYVLSTQGKWDMLSISYFTSSYWTPGPWWNPLAGHWVSYNYGEQDTINTIYTGSAAQTYYNSVTGFPGGTLTWSGVLTSALTGALVGVLTAGPVGLAVGAVIGIVTSIAIGLTYALLSSEYNNIYQSTFADQNWGHKYMWMFLTCDYYYPWEPEVVLFQSSVSISGYLSNGNVQGILPTIPLGPAVGPAVGAYISQGANNFVSSYGHNNFVYMGC